MAACTTAVIHSISITPLKIKTTSLLTLVMMNKLRCHAYFQFSTNQITWSRLLTEIHILNGKQCRSRSVGFFRSQLIWTYTVCKGMVYPGSTGLRLKAAFASSCECVLLFFFFYYYYSIFNIKTVPLLRPLLGTPKDYVNSIIWLM